ncbi:dihydroxyacetone kinase family protein [uncultured Pseudokineococcus sp.]|uniref:dihydroxyacetone kinase family protein n=1 Tax=uncultured Pseudokineococcus sp. TaxID=1642928 RepID=UPI00260B3C04|nr:dihydroxyacetone kinase family protein [uncultured Pseudokineococcus sp.]
MTRLHDDPATFSDDALAGFLDAHAGRVVGVPGGVVRARATREGKVAVVVGGGSGHYPAFCGVVGPGYADGAVVGNVFTSPSATEAAAVSRAAHGGGGVLLTTGNYAGDVLNFGLAVEHLRAEGLDARYVAVTDDVASAGGDEVAKRRGIAGDVTVFKCACAAAEEGLDLDGVEEAARRANDRTRSLGVAFTGCTLPGADAPLFTVPEGVMSVGLGIHGEPGVSDEDMPTAAELAARLVDGVLAEAPEGLGDGPRRVAAVLNGLGTVKYEELFVLWRTVARLLREAGLEVVEPEVGELVTSLDMGGVSLTLMWLDDDLERWWRAPADSPAYRKGSTDALEQGPERSAEEAAAASAPPPEEASRGSEESRALVPDVVRGAEAVVAEMAGAEDELGRIDAVAGDGDHGRGMVRGSRAALDAAREAQEQGRGTGGAVRAAGAAWADRAGGTSGVLWGAALTAVGARLGDEARPGAADVVDAVDAGMEVLLRLGGASVGDKTMLDAIEPFRTALRERVEAGDDLATAWDAAATSAEEAATATADLRPRVGRARPLAERSLGTPDAGATSFGLVARTLAGVLRG